MLGKTMRVVEKTMFGKRSLKTGATSIETPRVIEKFPRKKTFWRLMVALMCLKSLSYDLCKKRISVIRR
jgi:hypothetical protein